jgi:hypothetical protein
MKPARSLVLVLGIALACTASTLAAKLPPAPDPTLHLYRENLDGGARIVVAHHVAQSLVRRIRTELRAEASRYARGAYPDPAGSGKTPAVALLHAGAARVSVTYSDIKDGGAIRFVTKDPSLVSAIHAWFAASVAENRKKTPSGGPGADY